MKNVNPWAFAILVLIIIVFANITDINWDLLFTKNRIKTKAYITNTRIVNLPDGVDGYHQYLDYIFFVDNKTYKGYKKIDNRYRWQHIGNTLEIQYAKNSPKKNGVIKFNNEFKNSNSKNFSILNKETSEQIILINNIYS